MERYDFPRRCFTEGAWPKIVTNPGYNLGLREIAALEQLVLQTRGDIPSDTRLCHLAVGTGREVGCFAGGIYRISEYVLNDICPESLEAVFEQSRVSYPKVRFVSRVGDIEEPCVLSGIREEEPDLLHAFILVGNCVIFADRVFDDELGKAMRPGDLFMITAETPHKGMFDSYRIPPVYELLSRGQEFDTEEFEVSFNDETSCVEVARGGEVLLASYKPTSVQLKERLGRIGLTEVVFAEYPDLHMIGGLFRKN